MAALPTVNQIAAEVERRIDFLVANPRALAQGTEALVLQLSQLFQLRAVILGVRPPSLWSTLTLLQIPWALPSAEETAARIDYDEGDCDPIRPWPLLDGVFVERLSAMAGSEYGRQNAEAMKSAPALPRCEEGYRAPGHPGPGCGWPGCPACHGGTREPS